jgi:predicted ester cyclase
MPADALMEYERIWVDGLNRGDVSAADRAFLADCIVHITGVPDPFRGVGPWKEFVAGLLIAFPDFHLTIEDQLVQGDRVAFRWRATGTNSGPLGPAPATGRRVTIDGLIIDRVLDGKVQERWEQFDQSVMLTQLGLA